MPEISPADDWGTLAYRVRLLEDRATEDRRAMNAAIELMRREHDAELHAMRGIMHDEYLTKDQIEVRYTSRAEARQVAAVRREWPLILFGAMVALGEVANLVISLRGGR
jgi:hypothetical protein